jgi:hypothetical protein
MLTEAEMVQRYGFLDSELKELNLNFIETKTGCRPKETRDSVRLLGNWFLIFSYYDVAFKC